MNKSFLRTIIFFLITISLSVISCTSIDFYQRQDELNNKIYKRSNELSLLTYNIKAIYEKEEHQVDSLMQFVNNNRFDFVVFQELFDESTREEIINKANPEHYQTFISRVDYNSFPEFIFQDAGLFMMSKYPRIDLSDIEFDCDIKNSSGIIHRILEKEYSRTNDFLANKSVLGALFKIDSTHTVFLFTTHVQAAGTSEHKQFQLRQIEHFISTAIERVVEQKLIANPENLVVLLAGDFNSNAYDPNRFNQFKSLLGNPRDLHKDYHGSNHEYTFRNRARRYDYILSYDAVDKIELRKIKVNSINVKNVLDKNGESISDHRGIKAVLNIK